MPQFLELFWQFFTTDFKLRYKHSYLGLLWVVLKPLSLFGMLYFIWTAFLGNSEGFALSLLLGVLYMNFVNEGILFGLQSLINKTHIILKIRFPREIVVFSALGVAVMNFLINLLVFFVIAILSNAHFSIKGILLGLCSVLLTTCLLLGIALFLSVLNIIFQDIRHLIDLLLQILFWGTPVLYSLSKLHNETVKRLIQLNPFTALLDLLRGGFLSQPIETTLQTVLVLIFIIVVITGLSYLFFKKNIVKIAEFF